MNARRLLVPLGVLAAAVGAAFTLRPGLVPDLPLTTLFVLGVWAVGLAGAGLAVLGRLTDRGPETGRLPTAGERPAYPVPGDDLAARTAAVGATLAVAGAPGVPGTSRRSSLSRRSDASRSPSSPRCRCTSC